MSNVVAISETERVQRELVEVREQKEKLSEQRGEALRRRQTAIEAGDQQAARVALREEKDLSDELELLEERERHLREKSMQAARQADAAAKIPALVDECKKVIRDQPRLNATAEIAYVDFLNKANRARNNVDRATTLRGEISSLCREAGQRPPDMPEIDLDRDPYAGFVNAFQGFLRY